MSQNTSSKSFHASSFSSSRSSRFAQGLLSLGLGTLLLTGCGPGMSPEEDEEETLRIQASNLYVASSTVWATKNIPVCWENPTIFNLAERGWVRSAVAGTWDVQSAVNFTGWGACSSSSSGIRIQIADEGPHTKALGKNLNGFMNGMVLNFSFQNWSTSCQSDREHCIRVIAVHEFGHALGFAHEQNRSDTPSSCTEAPQGSNGDTVIGPWDLDSVMNYCNPDWNGNGQLSSTDIQGVQQVYGKSTDVGVIPNTASCPSDLELISIYLDDEDTNNADSSWGWKGAVTSGSNTEFRVCRTAGSQFKALTSTINPQKYYAVLKLGQVCPSGSTEFARYFDNEDTNNNNDWSAQWSSSIAPNTSNRNTKLYFCLFATGAQTMSSFPSLGISYGVFAASDLDGALATGGVHTDDEDSDNANDYSVVSIHDAPSALRIVSSGRDTDLHLAQVR